VTFHGFSPAGKNAVSGDPYVESALDKGRVERDVEQRRAIVEDLQKHPAQEMCAISPHGQASCYVVTRLAPATFVLQGPWTRRYTLWVNDTKPAFRT
jgi:hypothetical protein